MTGINIHETIKVDDTLEIRAYYAGHVCVARAACCDTTWGAVQVLGAAMFHVRVGQASAVYTGDYNMTPDRHLGAAWIDKVRPDLLITETT